jgi:hypothetical protein
MEACLRGDYVSGKPLWVLAALLAGAASLYGQPSWDVTPFVGGRFGGSIKLQQGGQAINSGTLEGSFGYGVAAGYRWDDEYCERCNLIEARWMRQRTNLSIPNDNTVINLGITSFKPVVTLDHFLADFTREFPLHDTHEHVRPFLTLSLGAMHMSTPVEGSTRFEFGIGTGVKVFPWQRWGFRLQAEYLPMVRYAEIQAVACGATCIFTLNGGVMHQVAFSVGPVFRF